MCWFNNKHIHKKYKIHYKYLMYVYIYAIPNVQSIVRMYADTGTIVNNIYVLRLVMWTRSCRKENRRAWEVNIKHILKK